MVAFYENYNRIVTTDCGKVRGIACGDPAFTVFRGIPYAKPPVGELRWRRPQPMDPWEGIKDCMEFSKIAHQPYHPVGTLYANEFYRYEELHSEDCLYLNVWTPSRGGGEKLPVLFWVHGGALIAGYGNEPEFDGEAFCREGVILVTCNYRLGIMGFYANSELIEEEGSAGNYGHMDQIAALKWVRRNIAAFGGDPDKITIFGQSAGAASVQAMAASPLAKGDIAGCIIMSASSVSKPGAADWKGRSAPLAKMAAAGDQMLKESGYADTNALRQLSYDELMQLPGMAMEIGKERPKYFFTACVDGYVINEPAGQTAFAGTLPDIPFMVGNTMDEGKGFAEPVKDLEEWKTKMESQYGKVFGERFPAETMEEAERMQEQMHHMMLSNRGFCECLLRAGKKPAYIYLFDHALPGNDDGSFHSSELWYVFGTLHRCWRPMGGADFDLSRQMVRAWANFAKNGNPNGEGVPAWRPYTEKDHCHMVFSGKSECRNNGQTAVQDFFIADMIEKLS